jgi:general secretion pathway protein K
LLFRGNHLSQPKLHLKTQRGTAIITALLVVSLVAVATVAMITRLQSDMRRTELLLNSEQAYLYAQGSVAWAIDQLNNNWIQKKPDQLIDAIPIVSGANQMQGFTIQSTILDAQANFNLNNVSNEDYAGVFGQLLKSIAPGMPPATIASLNDALQDWTMPTAANNDMNNYYISLKPAYRSPHHVMTSASELRLLKGMTPQLYTQLLPLVTALPIVTAINVNTASAEVLNGLGQNLNGAAVVSLRRQAPFTNIAKFLDSPAVKSSGVNANSVCVASSYFLVKTVVSIGQQQTILYTLLARATQGSKAETTIVWQTKGTV